MFNENKTHLVAKKKKINHKGLARFGRKEKRLHLLIRAAVKVLRGNLEPEILL